MSTQVERRFGTQAQIAAFTGASGEFIYDTDRKTIVVQDGATVGGFPVAALHLAQTFVPSQTFANTENFFGSTANGAPVAKFLSTPGAGFSTLDFNANGTPDLNFLRKYNSTPFQIELAGSGGIDLVIDSNNNETGTSVRFLTNAIRGGVQTTLFTVFDNGAVTITGPVSFPDGITQVFNPNGTNSGFNVGANAVDPSAPVNGDIWYQSTANELRARINGVTVALGASGASPPFLDTNPLVMGSADATKLLRFEVDGFTTATTRVLTPPNQNATIAGLEVAQTFTVAQTFAASQTIIDLNGVRVGVATLGTPSELNISGSATFANGKFLTQLTGQTFIGPIGNTAALLLSVELTGAFDTPVIDLAAVWDTTGAPTAIFLDVTDTASNTASLLMDLQVGTVSQFSVSKAGSLRMVGSLTVPYRAVAGTDTFAATDHTIDATSGTFTLNLPTAVGIAGRIYVAKNSGVGTITLDGAAAELIDGLATATIVAGAALMVQSTGSGWVIL